MLDNYNNVVEVLAFTLIEHLLNGMEEFLKFNISLLKDDAIIKPECVKNLDEHFNNLALLNSFIQALTMFPKFKGIDWIKPRQGQFRRLHELFQEYSMALVRLMRKYGSSNHQIDYQSDDDGDE